MWGLKYLNRILNLMIQDIQKKLNQYWNQVLFVTPYTRKSTKNNLLVELDFIEIMIDF